MATKKVFYYHIKVKRQNTNILLNNSEVRELFNNIFENNSIIGQGVSHLILDNGNNILERITMDILSNNENYLFGRIGKFKDNSEALMRNINTFETGDVGDDERILEVYTYFLYDYENGILGFIKGQSAPSPNVCEKIVNNYRANDYEMIMENIVSPETVRALNTPGASLGKIEYSYRIPNIYILSQLGLTREIVDRLDETDYKTVRIAITNENRKSLTGDNNVISSLIDLFSANRSIDKKAFKGKVPSGSSQEYKFEIENFYTKVDIPTTRVVDGTLERYTLEEIATEVLARMRVNYQGNLRHILRFANLE